MQSFSSLSKYRAKTRIQLQKEKKVMTVIGKKVHETHL